MADCDIWTDRQVQKATHWAKQLLICYPAPIELLNRPPFAMGEHERAFWLFHTANPAVLLKLREMACGLVRRGQEKVSIYMLFEVLRWQHLLDTDDPSSEFKLNNNYRPYYARLLTMMDEELEGRFEMRSVATPREAA